MITGNKATRTRTGTHQGISGSFQNFPEICGTFWHFWQFLFIHSFIYFFFFNLLIFLSESFQKFLEISTRFYLFSLIPLISTVPAVAAHHTLLDWLVPSPGRKWPHKQNLLESMELWGAGRSAQSPSWSHMAIAVGHFPLWGLFLVFYCGSLTPRHVAQPITVTTSCHGLVPWVPLRVQGPASFTWTDGQQDEVPGTFWKPTWLRERQEARVIPWGLLGGLGMAGGSKRSLDEKDWKSPEHSRIFYI